MIKALAEENNEGYLEDYFPSVRRQLHDSDLPLVDDILRDVFRTLYEGTGKESVSKTKLSSGEAEHTTAPYNRIPGEIVGPCREVLIAYCLGRGFRKWLDAVLEHAEKCNHRQIYLVTYQWGPTVWKDYEQRLQDLSANVTVLLAVSGRLVILFG